MVSDRLCDVNTTLIPNITDTLQRQVDVAKIMRIVSLLSTVLMLILTINYLLDVLLFSENIVTVTVGGNIYYVIPAHEMIFVKQFS